MALMSGSHLACEHSLSVPLQLHLVFEFIDRTILDELEANPKGLEPTHVRSRSRSRENCETGDADWGTSVRV